MIVNERALGGRNRLLHGLELHRDVGAGPPVLDHSDHRVQMAVRALEAFDDAGMGCVSIMLCHNCLISP